MNQRSKLILKYLGEGRSYKEIADMMDISIDMVRYSIKDIYKTLGVKNKVSALGKFNRNIHA
jgi:DNA-binding CsgD family transcriptional regulator